MAIRNIRIYGDTILSKTSKPVTEFDGKLHTLLDDLRDTIAKHDAMGIAAVQAGILRRAIVVDAPRPEDDDKGGKRKNRHRRKKKPEKTLPTDYGFYELINPEIIDSSGEDEMYEACLSLPGKNAPLKRPTKITLKYQDREGNEHTAEATNVLARAICHEVDHLNGVMFVDLIEPGTLQDYDEDD